MGLPFTLAVTGCGDPMPPEQKEVIKRILYLGGHYNSQEGGLRVDFKDTPVEDKDLPQLQKLDNLVSLDLRGTNITDEGLKSLAPISTLEVVNFQRSRVTPEGIAELKKSLPKTDLQH